MSDRAPNPSPQPPSESAPLKEVERWHIIRVLAAFNGNRTKAARVLGIHRRSLYRRLDEYGLRTNQRNQ